MFTIKLVWTHTSVKLLHETLVIFRIEFIWLSYICRAPRKIAWVRLFFFNTVLYLKENLQLAFFPNNYNRHECSSTYLPYLIFVSIYHNCSEARIVCVRIIIVNRHKFFISFIGHISFCRNRNFFLERYLWNSRMAFSWSRKWEVNRITNVSTELF